MIINKLLQRKIPKISPRVMFFKGPFRGAYIFGGANLWREICLSKSIELTLYLVVNLLFLFGI